MFVHGYLTEWGAYAVYEENVCLVGMRQGVDLDGPITAGELEGRGQGHPRMRLGHGILPWLWRTPSLDRREELLLQEC